jgi:hypothetical protein
LGDHTVSDPCQNCSGKTHEGGVTVRNFSSIGPAMKKPDGKTRARADELEAQRSARPKLSREGPKTANARLDRPQAAVEIPSEPPQSPEPHNKDA